jgi:hypothetical protein
MNLLKWVLIFAFAFVVAWVLIFTFTQSPFAEKVPAKIFAYKTPAIPVYVYVTGAFGIGLLLGCSLAFYNFITGRIKIFKLNKKIHSLEGELTSLKPSQEMLPLNPIASELPSQPRILSNDTHQEGIAE